MNNQNSQILLELVLPAMTNHHGSLFAGHAMKMLCKAAFITSRKFAQQEVVMAAVNFTDFVKPVPLGATLILQSNVTRVGKSSMTVLVEAGVELPKKTAQRVMAGSFELVAIDAEGKPCRIKQTLSRPCARQSKRIKA